MKLPEFQPGNEPKFNLDDKVWAIQGKTIHQERISSILLRLVRENKGAILICAGYTMSLTNLDTGDSAYPPHLLYATEAEAKELAAWHPVSDISETEWKQAIGNRETEGSTDDCELTPCCADISHMRDILLECQRCGGLIERDLRDLRILRGKHEIKTKHGGQLERIFRQLGFS